MGRAERQQLIREIEQERGSRLISYVTGDRSGAESRIGMDVHPFFYEILREIDHTDRLDLFIYSTGGITMAAWGLVNLIREFCGRLAVLVPFKAYSSATLISLGADEILMSRMGQLSPVDPTITGPYNPIAEGQPEGASAQLLPLSVEDVVAYIDLAKELNIKSENHIAEVFDLLSHDVRPIALGNVFRAKQQIRLLSEKLLAFHMTDKEKIQSIVTTLVRELYSHDYLIGRTEAKDHIGLTIGDISPEFESKIISLYNEYSDALELTVPVNEDNILGGASTKVAVFDQAIIESADTSYVYRTKKEFKRIKGTQKGVQVEGVQRRLLDQGWQPLKQQKDKK